MVRNLFAISDKWSYNSIAIAYTFSTTYDSNTRMLPMISYTNIVIVYTTYT